ncbi:small ribosomal subunit protein eS17-like [Notamacropus eugenii]|uniref:small ribosomal subunit protein eS17-like n=1 Tax=Notamacropus eugenii TaxID=9315 RepID=UPI003B670299
MGHMGHKNLKKVAQFTPNTCLGNEFHTNKCVRKLSLSLASSTKKIVGYVTHLMKWMQRVSVCASNCELSALDQEIIEMDPGTKKMLILLHFGNLSSFQVTQPMIGMNL